MTAKRAAHRTICTPGGKIMRVPLGIAQLMHTGTLSIVIPTDASLAPQVLDLETGQISVLKPQ